MRPKQVAVPDEVRLRISAEDLVELRIPGVVGKLSGEMRKGLDVHHHGNPQVRSDRINAPHLGRIERKVILELADAGRSVSNRLTGSDRR